MSRAMLLGMIAAAASAGPARAEPVGTLVPQVEPRAALGARLVARLHKAVVRGLGAGGLTAIPAEEAQQALARDGLESCDGGPCVAAAAAAMGAGRIVSTFVQVTGKNYQVECSLLDRGGAVLATKEGSCGICTFVEAEDAVAVVAQDLAKASPAEAAAAPPAPVPAPDAAGAVAREASADAGMVFDVTDVGGVARPRRARPYLWHAIGGWTLGVVGMGVGGYLMALHGDPSCACSGPDCAGFDAQTDCPELFATGGIGAALFGLGLASFGGGFLFFFREEPPPVSGGKVSLDGGGVPAARLRF